MAGGASISFDRCVGFRVQQDIVDLVNSCSPLDTCRYIGKAKVVLGESPTTIVSFDHHVTLAVDRLGRPSLETCRDSIPSKITTDRAITIRCAGHRTGLRPSARVKRTTLEPKGL